MKTNKAYWVKDIDVIDPDTNNVVELSIYKHENGGIFAIDSSFIIQMLDDDEPLYDPFALTIDEPQWVELIDS